MLRRSRLVSVLALTLLITLPSVSVHAFTQRAFGLGFGNAVPMGHEWLTRLAAIELIGYSGPNQVPDVPDPNDPRQHWTQGRARNLDISSPGARNEVARIKSFPNGENDYRSRYDFVLATIIGQRWVDLGGYNAGTSKNCFDSVSQEAVDVQYDHFMRRWDDQEQRGGLNAAVESRKRFVQYFVNAAIAPQTIMNVYDGGVVGSTAMNVDRNYFLFGRALHLFQDSFSPEHTVRIPADNYVTVRQVKAYMCSRASEQHSHSNQAVIDYSSGDVVWLPGTNLLPGWQSYRPSFMKVPPLVAVEATKDLWAAFIRTMGTPVGQREDVARREAETLATNWLGSKDEEVLTWYDDRNHRGPTFVLPASEDPSGQSVTSCMKTSGFPESKPEDRAKNLAASRRVCLYNALAWKGYSDLYDTSMHLWYAWQWRNKLKLEDPPAGWTVPERPADTGRRVNIRSVSNGHTITASDGFAHDKWVYCRPGPPIDFILVDGSFRTVRDPLLFLSYTYLTGAVKLWKSSPLDPTVYAVHERNGFWTIQLTPTMEYMWLKGESPYLTKAGNPDNANARWQLDPVR